MISQSAAPAAPAATAGANPAAVLSGGDSLPADLLAALFAASGPPFAVTLQALHALAPALTANSPVPGAPAGSGTKAGAAAAAGEALPAGLLAAQLGATASSVPQSLQALQAALTGAPSGGRSDSSSTAPTAPTLTTAPGGAAPAQLLLANLPLRSKLHITFLPKLSALIQPWFIKA